MEATNLIKEKLIEGIAKRVAIKDVLIRQSDLADMLEEYHQAQLKLLCIGDVVGRSEQLVCPRCDGKNIVTTFYTDGYGCNDCGEYWAK